MGRESSVVWRAVAASIVGVAAIALIVGGRPAQAQVGPQLIVTMNLAGPAKAAGGAYFIAFNTDSTILLGPQSDSSYWTHYVLYRENRFFFGQLPFSFGQIPAAPIRPFDFVTIRPPAPFLAGQVLPDGRALRVAVALADLGIGTSLPTQVKVNFVTVNDYLQPLDALGRGASDRFGFVTLDLRRTNYRAFSHTTPSCPDPSFCITGGDLRIAFP